MDERERLVERAFEAQRTILRATLHEQLEPMLTGSLTVQQLRLLAVVCFHGERPMRELADALHVSMPTVSESVDRLVERGLVTRRAGEGDRRVRLVALTAEGERLVRDVSDAGMRFGRGVLDEIDTPTLRGFVEGYSRIAAVVERQTTQRGEPST